MCVTGNIPGQLFPAIQDGAHVSSNEERPIKLNDVNISKTYLKITGEILQNSL